MRIRTSAWELSIRGEKRATGPIPDILLNNLSSVEETTTGNTGMAYTALLDWKEAKELEKYKKPTRQGDTICSGRAFASSFERLSLHTQVMSFGSTVQTARL